MLTLGAASAVQRVEESYYSVAWCHHLRHTEPVFNSLLTALSLLHRWKWGLQTPPNLGGRFYHHLHKALARINPLSGQISSHDFLRRPDVALPCIMLLSLCEGALSSRPARIALGQTHLNGLLAVSRYSSALLDAQPAENNPGVVRARRVIDFWTSRTVRLQQAFALRRFSTFLSVQHASVVLEKIMLSLVIAPIASRSDVCMTYAPEMEPSRFLIASWWCTFDKYLKKRLDPHHHGRDVATVNQQSLDLDLRLLGQCTPDSLVLVMHHCESRRRAG